MSSPKGIQKLPNNRYGIHNNLADLGSTDSYVQGNNEINTNMSHNILSPQTLNNLNKLNTPLMKGSQNDSSTNLSQNSGNSASSGIPKFCTGCGWKHRDIDRFCGGCGAKRV